MVVFSLLIFHSHLIHLLSQSPNIHLVPSYRERKGRKNRPHVESNKEIKTSMETSTERRQKPSAISKV